MDQSVFWSDTKFEEIFVYVLWEIDYKKASV
jgi:hypothetical protein